MRMGVVAGIAVAMTACGGAPAATPARTPAAQAIQVPSCLTAADAPQAVRFHAADGATLDGAAIGSGSTAIVFSNDRGDDPCAWLTLAREVKGMGYRVLFWSYGGATPRLDAEAAAAVAEARSLGSNRILVIGASVGAAAAFVAATTLQPALAGLVALTCEQDFPVQRLHPMTVAPALRVPILLVGTEDGYYSTGDQTRALFAVIGSPDKRLLVLPGSQSGASLLSGSTGDQVRASVIDFVQKHSA